MNKKPHGSFAFSFERDFTLISVSESWNIECTKIYSKMLETAMKSDPEQKRCVIIDGRKWGFETPESSQIIRALNQYVTKYYEKLSLYCLLFI